MTDTATLPGHPAKFSASVLGAVEPWLDREQRARGFGHDKRLRILDNFAGVGGVHALNEDQGDETWGAELEYEWACQHPRNIVADALFPPWQRGSFHVWFTSPTYGNRLADLYDGRDGSKRFTYRIALGHDLSHNSSGGMQWGPQYRSFHLAVTRATLDCLDDSGLVIINMSNHFRTMVTGEPSVEMHVVEWWVSMLIAEGLRLLAVEPVGTPRIGMGDNHELRADTEFIIVFRKVPADEATLARGETLGPRQKLAPAKPDQMSLLS